MTSKEIYCMGRSEYLATYEGYTLLEGYKKAEEEWNNDNRTDS